MSKQPRLGSGGRFEKLSATLAARGAHDPDALAAWIGRRKYGSARMGRLSHTHANPGMGGLLFADGPTAYHRDPDENVRCPSCGRYNDDDARFCDQCSNRLPASAFQAGDGMDTTGSGTAGTSMGGQGSTLRTPANANLQSATGYSPASAGMNVRSGAGGPGLANSQDGIGLARRMPVTSPSDVIVTRGADGRAVIRHRRGGDKIGEVFRTEAGRWKSAAGDGTEGEDRTHQRTALADLLGVWNRGTASLTRAAQGPAAPLQPPPEQTPLMQRWGVPAIRALATPASGSGDGPRDTAADTNGGDDDNGLNAKGQAILKKLLAKGWPRARAMQFAKNAQNMQAGQFRKAS